MVNIGLELQTIGGSMKILASNIENKDYDPIIDYKNIELKLELLLKEINSDNRFYITLVKLKNKIRDLNPNELASGGELLINEGKKVK